MIDFDKSKVYAGLKKYYYKVKKNVYYCFYDGFGSQESKTRKHLPLDDYHIARMSEQGWKEAEEDFNRHSKKINKFKEKG